MLPQDCLPLLQPPTSPSPLPSFSSSLPTTKYYKILCIMHYEPLHSFSWVAFHQKPKLA